MDKRPSVLILHFLVGFVVAAVLTMATLILVRPLMPASQTMRIVAVYSPLVTGILMGLRVVYVGRRHGLSLKPALKKSIAFWTK